MLLFKQFRVILKRSSKEKGNEKEKYKGKWVNGYYHIRGNKWFNFDTKQIEHTYL